MGYSNLNFFGKRGEYLNFVYDPALDRWSGRIDMGLVSQDLAEDHQVYVTEDVLDESTGQITQSLPVGYGIPQTPYLVLTGASSVTSNGTYLVTGSTTVGGTVSPVYTSDTGFFMYYQTGVPFGRWMLYSDLSVLQYRSLTTGAPSVPPYLWTNSGGAGAFPPPLTSATGMTGLTGALAWSGVFSPTGASAHFLYAFEHGPTSGEQELVRDRIRQYSIVNQQYSIGASGEKRVPSVLRSEAMQINVGFIPPDEENYTNVLRLLDVSAHVIAEIEVYGEGEGEDDRLSQVLATFGQDIVVRDSIIFDEHDVEEPLPDYLLINRKRKELLLEYERIFPFVGSYRALINAIRFFGHQGVRLKEYWKNVDQTSRMFGKYRQTDVVDVFDPSANYRDSVSVPSKVYKKTSKFGLFYDITAPDGTFDEQGVPNVAEVYTFTPQEVLIKIYALKNKLKEQFLPTNARIVDIVGEAITFLRMDFTAKTHQARVDAISLSIGPTFSVLPADEVWSTDLRPMYYFGCPIGPDLRLDGTTDLLSWRVGIGNTAYVGGVLDGIQTYAMQVTIPGPTSVTVSRSFARDPDTGQTAYSGPEIADALIEEWNASADLAGRFTVYQEGGDSGIIRIVQTRADGDGSIFSYWYSNTTGVIPNGKFTLPGPTGGTSASINVSSGPSGTFGPSGAPMSYYSDCFLAYFDSYLTGVTGLNDAPGIPVGFPVTLVNTTFDLTWDAAEVTFNQLDVVGPSGLTRFEPYSNSVGVGWTSVNPHPDLPAGATYVSVPVLTGVTGFPIADYPTPNVYSWENVGNRNFYEMQWTVTYEGPGPTAWSATSGRVSVLDGERWPLVLPYEGTYQVELLMWDTFNSVAYTRRKSRITARVPDASFVGWYRALDPEYTWDTPRYGRQSDYSRNDPRIKHGAYLTLDEYTSTWDLPIHPTEEIGMADVSFESMDAIEFYQSQNEEALGLMDRDSYRYNLVEASDARIGELHHLWWKGMGDRLTQFQIQRTGTGATFYLYANVESSHYDVSAPARAVNWAPGPTGWTGPVGVTALAGSTGDLVYVADQSAVYEMSGGQWRRAFAFAEGIDLVGLGGLSDRDWAVEVSRQLNDMVDLDPRDLPVLRSFIYHMDARYAADASISYSVRAVSIDGDKHDRVRLRCVGASCGRSAYATTHYGYIGDVPAHFEVYSVGPTGGSIWLTGMTAPWMISATGLVGLADELNGPTAQSDPVLGSFGYNCVLGFSGWTGGTGPTAHTEIKVIAVSDSTSAGQTFSVEYGGSASGTVFGRSFVSNPTYDDLRILKYAEVMPILSQVHFTWDACRIPGKTSCLWRLSKMGDGGWDTYSRNPYFSYLFTERGSYEVGLTIVDTNGNEKTVAKTELIRID